MAKMKLAIGAILVATLFGALTAAPAQGASTPPSKTGSFFVGWNNTTPVGKVDTTYKGYWQPYPNGMSGKYYSDDIISIYNGAMVIAVGNGKGAAGTFGTPTKAYSHIGGTFSIRARTTGGSGNGIAVMLWPSSDRWADGELDFPEGGFGNYVNVFHHSTISGSEGSAVRFQPNVKWSDWHTYSTVWVPGKSVKYYVDDKLIGTVTKWVPTTAHRYMIQTGNTGKAGKLYIDWVRTT